MPSRYRRLTGGFAVSALMVLVGASSALYGLCGPFTDVAPDAFCPFVLEIFYLGITTGTTATTYDPTGNVSRLQMAAFLSRTVDRTLQRGSRRASLSQFWTFQNPLVIARTAVGSQPYAVASDGADLWVANNGDGTVTRVRASDVKPLETWFGAFDASGVVAVGGRIYLTGNFSPGLFYRIDPSQPVGSVTTLATNLGSSPENVAFDGSRFWTANSNSGLPGGSVSIVTPAPATPWTVTTVTAGFGSPSAAVFDGTEVWVTDNSAGTLLKLSPAGAILQTVTVGGKPLVPIFDGSSIWVPNSASATVSVVRASTGTVLATLTGNGLNNPQAAAFDGQQVLVANVTNHSVSLWKAADLTPIGNFNLGAGLDPVFACSDGVSFWLTLNTSELLRF